MEASEKKGSGIGTKVLALGILVVAGWILLKIAIHIVAGLFWTVLVVVALIAIIWALRVL